MVEKGEKLSNDPYFSILRQTTVSNEDVDVSEKVYKKEGMQTFGDYVKYFGCYWLVGRSCQDAKSLP